MFAYYSIPGVEICTYLGIEVDKDDEVFWLQGWWNQSLQNFSLASSGLVRVGAYEMITEACFFPGSRSINAMSWSFTPLGRLDGFLTKLYLMVKQLFLALPL